MNNVIDSGSAKKYETTVETKNLEFTLLVAGDKFD